MKKDIFYNYSYLLTYKANFYCDNRQTHGRSRMQELVLYNREKTYIVVHDYFIGQTIRNPCLRYAVQLFANNIGDYPCGLISAE